MLLVQTTPKMLQQSVPSSLQRDFVIPSIERWSVFPFLLNLGMTHDLL